MNTFKCACCEKVHPLLDDEGGPNAACLSCYEAKVNLYFDALKKENKYDAVHRLVVLHLKAIDERVPQDIVAFIRKQLDAALKAIEVGCG